MRKPFHIKYLERPNETQILGRALALSNMVALTGIEGAGKTSLVKEFVGKSEGSAKWFTLSNFLTLSTLLGFPEISSEEALQKMLTALQNQNSHTVVWDNLHFLNFQNQQKLIYSIINFGGNQAHIFISDEALDLPTDIPQITIGGFSIKEIKAFFDLYETPMDEGQIEEVQVRK